MKKVTIHSDGFGLGTVVVDEDGNTIEGIVEAILYMRPREPNMLALEILAPSVQSPAHLDAVQLVCRICQGSVEHHCEPQTLSGQ